MNHGYVLSFQLALVFVIPYCVHNAGGMVSSIPRTTRFFIRNMSIRNMRLKLGRS